MSPIGPTTTDHAASPGSPSTAAQARQDEHREIDHRLANSLQLAADFLMFEYARVADPRARAALMTTADRLSAVGQMHRFLAAQHQAAGVDLEPFLTELGGLIADSTGLGCSVDADPVIVDATTAQQLAIAINEMAMNAAKHAYGWGDRGPIHIGCHRRNGSLMITVADQGEGLREDFDPLGPGGLGMSILQAIVRQLNGVLRATNDRGACFTITIPLPSPSPEPPRTFARGGRDD